MFFATYRQGLKAKVMSMLSFVKLDSTMIDQFHPWLHFHLVFLLVVLLVGCTPNPKPTTPARTVHSSEPTQPVQTPIYPEFSEPAPANTRTEPTDLAQTIMPSFPAYGVVYPYPSSSWTEADRLSIREHLEYLHKLGINTVLQVFSNRLIGTGDERNWLIFLDEAERADIQVVARLGTSVEKVGNEFDYQAIEAFLSVVQDHPALLAYVGLHEPLERFTSPQLREFYSEVKRLAPDLPIAHYMGNMSFFERSWRFPFRVFTAGICDICITWYYPARYIDNQPVFEEAEVRELLQTHRRLVDERAPESQLWFLGQSYTQAKHKRNLRMPTPQEMERLYSIVEQEGADGFLWYPWYHNTYDQVLSDDEMEPQRQAVFRIYEDFFR
jgi:hypothetical protein